MIVEDEQRGKECAGYGKTVLKKLSNQLTKEFGKGYSVTNLQQMRKFYMTYIKQQTVSVNSDSEIPLKLSATFEIEKSASAMRKSEGPFKLSWSHYIQLIHNVV